MMISKMIETKPRSFQVNFNLLNTFLTPSDVLDVPGGRYGHFFDKHFSLKSTKMVKIRYKFGIQLALSIALEFE